MKKDDWWKGKPGWPFFSKDCAADVVKVLKLGRLSAYRANPQVGIGPAEGSHAWSLEREIEKAHRVKHAIAVSSGTTALVAVLRAFGIKGKEVITSPFTFSATAAAVIEAGGILRFADVDPCTYCISGDTVKPLITKRTALILPVALFGCCPRPIMLGVPVIVDACQAVGVYRLQDGEVAAVYSFNGGKNVPAGEGGAVVTDDASLARQCRLIVNHGENFGASSIGFNGRMPEVTACIARHGLKAQAVRDRVRSDLAQCLRYTLFIRGSPIGVHIWSYRRHANYVFPFEVRRGNNQKVAKAVRKRGVSCSAGYIVPPLHKYPAFKGAAGRLPVVERLSAQTLCILSDITPDKSMKDIRRIAKVVIAAVKEVNRG